MLPNNLYYNINNETFFYPEQGLLKGCKSENEAKLSISAISCFELLIENHGVIVSQDMFFERVWQVRRIIITSNTLAKIISQLRQSLIKSGCQYDIIRTIKGKGYLLPSAFEVTKIENNAQPSLHTEDIVEVSTHDKLEPDVATENEISTSHKHEKSKKFFILLSIIPIFIILALLIQSFYPEKRIGYEFYTTSHGCNFYFISDSNSNKENILSLLMKRESFDCAQAPYVYVTSYKEMSHYSLFSCKEPIDTKKKSNQCYTIVHFNYRSENSEQV